MTKDFVRCPHTKEYCQRACESECALQPKERISKILDGFDQKVVETKADAEKYSDALFAAKAAYMAALRKHGFDNEQVKAFIIVHMLGEPGDTMMRPVVMHYLPEDRVAEVMKRVAELVDTGLYMQLTDKG